MTAIRAHDAVDGVGLQGRPHPARDRPTVAVDQRVDIEPDRIGDAVGADRWSPKLLDRSREANKVLAKFGQNAVQGSSAYAAGLMPPLELM